MHAFSEDTPTKVTFRAKSELVNWLQDLFVMVLLTARIDNVQTFNLVFKATEGLKGVLISQVKETSVLVCGGNLRNLT